MKHKLILSKQTMCTSTQPGRRAVPEECRFHSVPCTALHWGKGGCYNHVSTDSFRTDVQNTQLRSRTVLDLIRHFQVLDFFLYVFSISMALYSLCNLGSTSSGESNKLRLMPRGNGIFAVLQLFISNLLRLLSSDY
jgi:hypothetical protein